MALVDLKSNLANFRSDFKTIDLETRFVNPKSSTINIDSIPEPISLKSKLAPFSRKLTSSLLNIDDIPNKFSPGEIYRPSRYAIQKIVNASRFNLDFFPVKFSYTGKYFPSKYEAESKLPETITRWTGANGTAAEAVNYISDIKFGLRGFVTNFTDPNTSQFLGVAGSPLQNKFVYPATILGNRLMKPAQSAAFPGPQNFINNVAASGFTTNLGKSGQAEKSQFLGIEDSQYTYPATVRGNRLMKPSKSVAFPGPQNFIDNIKFGATGFTANLGKSGLAEKSQFLGIAGAPGNETYTYPGSTLLQGNRLMQPGRGRYGEVSLQNFNKTQTGLEQDFLDNKYASGFTTNMNLGPLDEKSQFKGITSNKFPLSDTYIIPDTKSTGPTGFEIGKTSLNNQLGNGSRFKFIKDGALTSKIFSVQGYSFSRKYNSVVASIVNQPQKSLLYTSSNPAALEEEYKKLNSRDEYHQTTYMKQPYILRGIQRHDNAKPQYWGFGSRSGFDDGLIRGGVVTVLDRIVADTVRIAKWMASPKGLLWIVKQIGLGLTNARVEKIGLSPFSRATRIHTGVASLLSVPGTALGLHFTRHGIPFLNEFASYEFVSKQKNSLTAYNPLFDTGVADTTGNRLIALRKEYAVLGPLKYTNKILLALQKTKFLVTKTIGSNILSGLGGSASVYGIGFTQIRRYVNTEEAAKQNAIQSGDFQVKFNSKYYDYYSPYYNGVGKNSTSTLKQIDEPSNDKLSLNNIFKIFNKIESDPIKEVTLPLRGDLLTSANGTFVTRTKINNPYNPILPVNGDVDAKRIVEFSNLEKPIYYVGAIRAKTGKTSDVPKESTSEGLTDTVNFLENSSSLSLKQTYDNLSTNTTFTPNPFNRKLESHTVRDITYPENTEIGASSIDQYITLAYNKIPNKQDKKSLQDFRSLIYKDHPGGKDLTPGQLKQLGTGADENYYSGLGNKNLETAYGFGNQGAAGTTTPARGKGSFIREGKRFATNGITSANPAPAKASHNPHGRFILARNTAFRGDKITAIDIGSSENKIELSTEIYDTTAKDLIKFWFEDGDIGRNVMPFRATLTGLTDSFSPGWNAISIMGRPDGAALYSSFERAISFEFKVAALSRSEMIPMWRKLNYLASYTMPDFNRSQSKPSGPFMRLTIGDLYYRCPGYLTSLTYTFPEDSSWDIADDFDIQNNADPKQLPMSVDVSVSYTIVNDYRPQTMGRVYSLSPYGLSSGINGQWLADAEGITPVKLTTAQIARNAQAIIDAEETEKQRKIDDEE